MIEHTIRNKAKNPIFTLRPPVLEAMLAARPESSSLTFARFSVVYKSLTGKSIHLDYDQQQLFLKRYGAGPNGQWTSKFSKVNFELMKVVNAFKDGYLLTYHSSGFLHDLALAELFYDMVERQANLMPDGWKG